MGPSAEVAGQHAARVRCEWGELGAATILGAPQRTAVVVVDVLSFTTAVSIAADRGIGVLPYPAAADGAHEYATRSGAVLAGSRSDRRASLSPASLATVAGVERVVIPSPNGSALSASLRDRGFRVVAGGLRNASAVGRWCSAFLSDPRGIVAVAMAGERWADGSLRPAAEDLWGAGAILCGVPSEALSIEARVAVDAFGAVRSRLVEAVRESVSGRELLESGFAADVDLAAELDASDGVPVLGPAAFVNDTALR